MAHVDADSPTWTSLRYRVKSCSIQALVTYRNVAQELSETIDSTNGLGGFSFWTQHGAVMIFAATVKTHDGDVDDLVREQLLEFGAGVRFSTMSAPRNR